MTVGAISVPIGLTVNPFNQQVTTVTNLLNGLIGPATNVQTVMQRLFSPAAFGAYLSNFYFLRADLFYWAKMTKELIGSSTALSTVLGNITLPGSLTQGLGFALNELRTVSTQLQAQVDRKSTRLNSSHLDLSRMPSSA